VPRVWLTGSGLLGFKYLPPKISHPTCHLKYDTPISWVIVQDNRVPVHPSCMRVGVKGFFSPIRTILHFQYCLHPCRSSLSYPALHALSPPPHLVHSGHILKGALPHPPRPPTWISTLMLKVSLTTSVRCLELWRFSLAARMA